ncbi:MAG: FliM/FliN family flagellar motor switch protein, partial [Pirellulales bacterium]
EISIGAARGLLNLCLPWPMIVVLASRLPEPFVPDAAADTAECRQEAAAQPAGTLVELVVEVEAGQISAEDLQALGVGDIITTSQAAAEPLIATVDGRPRFLVRPGSLGGQKAVEVQSALDTPTGESARRAG